MLQSLEDKLVEALRQAVPELKTVGGYSGELDRENLSTLLPHFPAAYVVIEGVGVERLDNRMMGETLTFSVLVCTSSRRSRDASRAEAYTVVEAAFDALANQRLGLDIEPLTPVSAQLVFVDNAIIVYGIRWQTALTVVPAVSPA